MLGPYIDIGGRRFATEYIYQHRKTIAAHFYSSKVTIRLPLSINKGNGFHALELFERRILKRLEKMSGNGFADLESREALPNFKDGQRINVLGREFTISITAVSGAKYSKARLIGNHIVIKVPELDANSKKDEHIPNLVRMVLSKCMLPDVRARLDELNGMYYNFSYNGVHIRKQMRLWGSASYPKNNINLNYKLLFAPQEMLDYVMVHELSHMKVRNHSRRFWELVERAVPDHKLRRKWLRENGNRLGMQEEAEQLEKVHEADAETALPEIDMCTDQTGS